MAQEVKNLPAMKETLIQSLGWEDPLEKGLLPPPIFLPGEFHEERILAEYSPWALKELAMIEKIPLYFIEWIRLFQASYSTDYSVHFSRSLMSNSL